MSSTRRGRKRGFFRSYFRSRSENIKTISLKDKQQICQVCNLQDHKYRCPRCSILYCSLSCYKTHNTQCQAELDIEDDPEDVAAAAAAAAAPSSLSLLEKHARRLAIKRGLERHEGEIELTSSASSSGEEEGANSENPDKLSRRILKELCASKRLKTLLANPHLRTALLEVDGALNKNAIMHGAMQEPLFVEFADTCLAIVEKNGK